LTFGKKNAMYQCMKLNYCSRCDTVRAGVSPWKRRPALTIALALSWAVWGCVGPSKTTAEESVGRITKGPCLLRVGRDRAALMWETDTEGPSGVSYGENGKLDGHCDGRAEKVAYGGGLFGSRRTTVWLHKVWIENLQPGRTYSYRITGSQVRSDIYTFRTIPAAAHEVRFIVYGDSRAQPQVHRRLVEQMVKHDVDFVVHVGDLVSRGDSYEQWGPQFFEPLRGLMERVPIYTAKGNHDGNGGTYEKLLVPPGARNDSCIDYGPLHYFLADNVTKGVDDGRLLRRMIDDAAAGKAPWKFISYHVPSLNFGGHRSDWQQKKALPAFAQAGVDFVVTGHSHLYERFRPVAPPSRGSYVTYITAGGGGAPLHPIAPTVWHACTQSIHQFCLFHIKGDVLTMDAIDVEGRIFDHLEIAKKLRRLDDPYVSTAVAMADILHH
jgi:predicted phosphodiesterase